MKLDCTFRSQCFIKTLFVNIKAQGHVFKSNLDHYGENTASGGRQHQCSSSLPMFKNCCDKFYATAIAFSF